MQNLNSAAGTGHRAGGVEGVVLACCADGPPVLAALARLDEIGGRRFKTPSSPVLRIHRGRTVKG